MAAECVSDRAPRADRSTFRLRGTAGWAETEEGQADALYAPYIERQRREWAAVERDRGGADSRWIWISRQSPGLSTEMVERLSAARPETLDQASRIAGITPAALSALHVAAVARRGMIEPLGRGRRPPCFT